MARRVASQIDNRPRGPEVSRSYPIPASVKGWVANQALTAMDEECAVVLDNIFPDPDGIRWRRGSQPFATLGSETTNVETLLIWQGGSTQKMFGCVNGKIYADASPGGTISTTVATGLVSNRWQQLQFSTAGGQFLLAVNGSDPYRQYDGTTWTTTAVTGPTAPNALIQLWSFKQRLFFIEAGTADAWYAPVNTITGALTKLPFGPLLTKGGSLMVGATWTHDTGASGPQDYCVFISSEGEVLIYAGTDPSSATTWSQVGRFQIGRPIGRRCLLNIGSDLVLLCSDGLMPFSKAIAFDRTAAAKAAFSWNIQKAFQDSYQAYSAFYGWQIQSYVGNNMAFINVPVNAGAIYYQYVMNVLTGAWCRYKGENGVCWGVMRDSLYYGGIAGQIWQAETGAADGTAPISAVWISAFNDLGQKGKAKSVRMVRPVSVGSQSFQPAIGVCVDYDLSAQPINPAPIVGGGGAAIALWDVALWDVAVWPSDSSVVTNWLPAYGEGFQVAASMSITYLPANPTINVDYKITVFNVLYEPGGII